MTSKRHLRQTFRELFEQNGSPTSPDLDDRFVERINAHLVDLLESIVAAGELWAAFQPTGFEPNILPTLEKLSRVEWVFPRIEGESLAFYLAQHPAVFELNRWGILEPDPHYARRIDPKEIRGLLIPGVAFDLNCNRLGRGRGFYDRTLAEIQSSTQLQSPIKIGVASEQQISPRELPIEAFDIPMDWVVTEARCLRRVDSRISQRKNS